MVYRGMYIVLPDNGSHSQLSLTAPPRNLHTSLVWTVGSSLKTLLLKFVERHNACTLYSDS